MKSAYSKLSLSRFSLNTVLRRHSRTNSLPESSLLQGSPSNSSSVVSVVSVDQQQPHGAETQQLEDAGCSNDEAAVAAPGASGRQRGAKSSATMKAERLCSRLGLAKHEKVLKACPCFLVSDLLVQGCLIITERHLCFYSSIFGLKKSKLIKLEEIVHISKEKVYALFPTGIEVRTRTEKVTFSSATSRDKLVKLIKEQCRRFQPCARPRDLDLHFLTHTLPGTRESPDSPDTISSELLASDEPAAAEQPEAAGPGPLAWQQLLVHEQQQQQQQQQQQLTAEDSSFSSPDGVRVAPALRMRDARRKSSLNPAASTLLSVASLLFSRSALCVMAAVLTLCVAAALYQNYRLSQLQDQVTQILVASSRELPADAPILDDRFDEELDKVIGTVNSLEDKLLHMRSLLRLLTAGNLSNSS